MTFFSDGDGGTPSHFVQAANLWYDIRDTYIVRFVVDGCRKNLPLSVRSCSWRTLILHSSTWCAGTTIPTFLRVQPLAQLQMPLQKLTSNFRRAIANCCPTSTAALLHQSGCSAWAATTRSIWRPAFKRILTFPPLPHSTWCHLPAIGAAACIASILLIHSPMVNSPFGTGATNILRNWQTHRTCGTTRGTDLRTSCANSSRSSPADNMVFTLGLRHTFRVWRRGLALVESLVIQTSFASFRAVS